MPTVTAPRLAGRVVVFDPCELNWRVRLRLFSGDARPLDWQRRIVRALSPRPAAEIAERVWQVLP